MQSISPTKRDFNPRLREGGDFPKSSFFAGVRYFNPRLREGGDYLPYHHTHTPADFNPRLREGGDFSFSRPLVIGQISIHASAREAT